MRSMVRPGVRLDIFSDVVCPWCYLGHHRLVRAIEGLGADAARIELRWRAYQLDPGAGAEPRELRPAIEAKYGPGAFDAMQSRLGRLGSEAGIEYRFDRALRVGTLDAHRLVLWAQEEHPESTGKVVDRLFRGYFTEGCNIADHPTLVRLASEVGLDAARVAEVLESSRGSEEVAADIEDAMAIGVTGVPAVVFNGAVVLPGVQDVDSTRRVLARLLDRVG